MAGRRLLTAVDGFEMHAPSLWVYELTSALGKTVHFGQVTAEEGARTLGLAQCLGMRLAALDDGLLAGALRRASQVRPWGPAGA